MIKSFVLTLFAFLPFYANAQTTERFDLYVDKLQGQPIILDGRIDLPANSEGASVLFMVEGSGPADADFSIQLPTSKYFSAQDCLKYKFELVGEQCRIRFDRNVSQQQIVPYGMAVVRIGKRGARIDLNDQPLPYDMNEHGTSTLTNRLSDLEKLLGFIRDKYPKLNSTKIFLWGVSEGTVVSTMYATAHADEVAGMILIGTVLDDLRWNNHFQDVEVIWPQLLKLADKDGDGRISRDEFNSTDLNRNPDPQNSSAETFGSALRNLKAMKINPTFEFFDLNKDGYITQSELSAQLERYYSLPKSKAIDANNLAAYLLLHDKDPSLAQYRDQYAYGRNADYIAQLKMPIALFTGKKDLNCPPQQLDWFVPMIQKMNKTNISAQLIDDYHYGPALAAAGVAKMFEFGWLK